MSPRRGEEWSRDSKTNFFLRNRKKDTLHIETQLFIAFKKHFKYKDKNGLKLKGGNKENESRYSKNRQSRLNKIIKFIS